jgi:hypothetical protein
MLIEQRDADDAIMSWRLRRSHLVLPHARCADDGVSRISHIQKVGHLGFES